MLNSAVRVPSGSDITSPRECDYVNETARRLIFRMADSGFVLTRLCLKSRDCTERAVLFRAVANKGQRMKNQNAAQAHLLSHFPSLPGAREWRCLSESSLVATDERETERERESSHRKPSLLHSTGDRDFSLTHSKRARRLKERKSKLAGHHICSMCEAATFKSPNSFLDFHPPEAASIIPA